MAAEAAGTRMTQNQIAQTQIHNIGYRGYDGPRLGRAYARRSLFSQSLRGAYGLAAAPSPRCCRCCSSR